QPVRLPTGVQPARQPLPAIDARAVAEDPATVRLLSDPRDRVPAHGAPDDPQRRVLHGPAGRQACGWVMLTIQGMPNWSTHMPNSSPHICFSMGSVTVPPADSLSQ